MLDSMLLELPRTGDSTDRFKWIMQRVGSVAGEINRRKVTLAVLTIELNKHGYEYEPRRCEHCGHWMMAMPVVFSGQFQGMKDRCVICETGNPMKDVPVKSLDLGRISG